jgi:hypothetical protein
MTRSDRWIGGIFFILGCLTMLQASKLDFKSNYGAGSGFFPFWLGVSTVILGTILTLGAVRNPIDTPAVPPQISWSKKKALAFAGLLFFVLSLELVGFVVGFSLLVAFLLTLEGENWRTAILSAVASGTGFYLGFVRLLDVKLPSGPWGF